MKLKNKQLLLDFFSKKRFNNDLRARPVGTGVPGMCCVIVSSAFSFGLSFSAFIADSVRGSKPLDDTSTSLWKYVRRGRSWLAFFISFALFFLSFYQKIINTKNFARLSLFEFKIIDKLFLKKVKEALLLVIFSQLSALRKSIGND